MILEIIKKGIPFDEAKIRAAVEKALEFYLSHEYYSEEELFSPII